MPKKTKLSEKTESDWTAIAVSRETHRQIKIAAAVAGLQISEFMEMLASTARAEAEKIANTKL